jgi:hypothetical protein
MIAAQALPTTVDLSPLQKTHLAAVSGVVKASNGNLFGVSGQNDNAAVRYLQFHNKATAPGAGETPVLSFKVAITSTREIGPDLLTSNGWNFPLGIAFGWSTTRDTYTAGTAADHTLFVSAK